MHPFWHCIVFISSILLLLKFQALYSRPNATAGIQVQIPCLRNQVPATLVDLVSCFNAYTTPEGAYANDVEYNSAQPSIEELPAWNAVVTSLLTVDGNCSSALLPPVLNNTYSITHFREAGGKSFCILSETQAIKGHYMRGWGLMVVPVNRTAVSRHIHISAPHPIHDVGTPQQAGAIFCDTGAKSLFVAGRHREAYRASSCVGPEYAKTDPTHDKVYISFSFFPLNLISFVG
jgi:hypothetical protein